SRRQRPGGVPPHRGHARPVRLPLRELDHAAALSRDGHRRASAAAGPSATPRTHTAVMASRDTAMAQGRALPPRPVSLLELRAGTMLMPSVGGRPASGRARGLTAPAVAATG